jgi:hypothetical protein
MPIQYISDNEGKHTAVLIPINEWELITTKHNDLKELETPSKVNSPKPSDFVGTLPKDIASQMQEYVRRSREEWK